MNNKNNNETTFFAHKIEELENLKTNDEHVATFEEAIAATGFGKFNYIFLILLLPASWACLVDATSMSFVNPEAQCDLGLNLVEMGILNAACFGGTIFSGFWWGYVADALGRKHILIYGFILNGFATFLSAFSGNFWMLLFLKITKGIIIAGPSAVMVSYMTEFATAKFRAPVILIQGIYLASTSLLLAALAWIIMPLSDMYLFNSVIHPWQIYLFVTGIPCLFSGICFIFMPESPKFLMAVGRNQKALRIFKKIYSMNTRKCPSTYPIKNLVDEIIQNNSKITADRSTKTALKEGWGHIKLMFSYVYIFKLGLITIMTFFTVLGANTLRLWLPELFTAIDTFLQDNGHTTGANLCTMIEYSITNHTEVVSSPQRNYFQNFTSFDNITSTIDTETPCAKIAFNIQVYINSVIVGVVTIILYVLATIIVNKVNKRLLLATMYLIAGLSEIFLIWSTQLTTILILSSLYSSFSIVAITLLFSITVELFPTNLRTMTIALAMIIGRIGTITGNVVFPVMLETGCLSPFLMTGGVVLVCILLVVLLPVPKQENFR